jgi:hypothetical protein
MLPAEDAHRALCGALPCPATTVLRAGTKVAAATPNVEAARAADSAAEAEAEFSWILATVRAHDPLGRTYTVTDDDDDSGATRHRVSERRVRALPTALPEAWTAAHEHGRGTRVLALWPDSTCFYPAIIGLPPSLRVRGALAAARARDGPPFARARSPGCARARARAHSPVSCAAPASRPRGHRTAQPERDYLLAFQDDCDAEGRPTLKRVPPKFVVRGS